MASSSMAHSRRQCSVEAKLRSESRAVCTQRLWRLSSFDATALWDSCTLVSALSALLRAHARLEEPSPYQQALLLQASAQLATLPCA